MKWLNLIGLIIGSGCQAVALNDQTMAPWLVPIGSLVLLVTSMERLATLFPKKAPPTE